MKSILEELFYGNVCPNTDCGNYEQETKELMGYLTTNREGVVTHIDDAGKIHGTWGGSAIIPEIDTYIIIPHIEK